MSHSLSLNNLDRRRTACEALAYSYSPCRHVYLQYFPQSYQPQYPAYSDQPPYRASRVSHVVYPPYNKKLSSHLLNNKSPYIQKPNLTSHKLTSQVVNIQPSSFFAIGLRPFKSFSLNRGIGTVHREIAKISQRELVY